MLIADIGEILRLTSFYSAS